MNKKQKNRKIVTQNNRNRMINRRYTSSIKTLLKLFLKKIKEISFTSKDEEKDLEFSNLFNLKNNLYSIIDKAAKKGVIHKNTAARKKSKIYKTYINIKT